MQEEEENKVDERMKGVMADDMDNTGKGDTEGEGKEDFSREGEAKTPAKRLKTKEDSREPRRWV